MHPIPPPESSSLPPRLVPARPLPPYRYVPGLEPHPTADSRGHSFQREPEAAQPFEPSAWHTCVAYLYGVDLFNHRYYWEAHEAWESVWHACDKSRAQGAFVQGLIQTAAALLRWHMGSERGARSLYASARQRFALVQREAPEGYMGIDWDRWLGELDAHFPIGRADAVVADATPGRTPLLEDDARARDSRGLPKASPLGPTPTRPEPPRATPGPGSSVVPPRLPLIELGFPSRTAAPAPFQSH